MISHSPAQCPSANKDTYELFAAAVARLEETSNEMGVSDIQFHALLPGHNGVIVMEAPNFKTVCRFLMELRIDNFHDISLYESVTAQEALAISGGRVTQDD
jgi:hypothetical protein